MGAFDEVAGVRVDGDEDLGAFAPSRCLDWARRPPCRARRASPASPRIRRFRARPGPGQAPSRRRAGRGRARRDCRGRRASTGGRGLRPRGRRARMRSQLRRGPGRCHRRPALRCCASRCRASGSPSSGLIRALRSSACSLSVRFRRRGSGEGQAVCRRGAWSVRGSGRRAPGASAQARRNGVSVQSA